MPDVPPSDWDGSLNRRASVRLPLFRRGPASFKGEIPRVVLVKSDQYYREVLTEELLRQGFAVHPFTDGAALLGSLATVSCADLAVLDWDLSGMPGTTLLAQLRQHGVKLPVVFLTGKVIASKQDERCVLAPRDALNAYECMAFDEGAVDFIPKSRDRAVLVRRLTSVVELVKLKAELPSQEGLVCGKLLLRPQTSRAFWNGVDVGLTLGEYNIVRLLASNVGRYVTFRAIYDRLHRVSSPELATMAIARTSGRPSSASATSSAPAPLLSTRSRTTRGSDTAGASQTSRAAAGPRGTRY